MIATHIHNSLIATDSQLEQRWMNSVRCPDCEAPLITNLHGVVYDNSSGMCICCQRDLALWEADIVVSPHNAHFVGVHGVQRTMSSPWFHSSVVDLSDFNFSPQSDAITHIGTVDSAIERAHHQGFHSYHLYEFAIRPSARIHPDIWVDNDSWSEPSILLSDGTYDIIRYINRWEAIGDVSLIVHPRALQLVDVSQLGAIDNQ